MPRVILKAEWYITTRCESLIPRRPSAAPYAGLVAQAPWNGAAPPDARTQPRRLARDVIVNAGTIGGAGVVSGTAAGGGVLRITNTGIITGAVYGIFDAGGSNVTNAAGAVIAGAAGGDGAGVEIQAGCTLTNAGIIKGGAFGVLPGDKGPKTFVRLSRTFPASTQQTG